MDESRQGKTARVGVNKSFPFFSFPRNVRFLERIVRSTANDAMLYLTKGDFLMIIVNRLWIFVGNYSYNYES